MALIRPAGSTCKECGEPFLFTATNRKRKQFCSRLCAARHQAKNRKILTFPCDNCQKPLTRPPSHFHGGRYFCNMECRKAYHRPMVQCRGCADTFIRRPKEPGRQYCTWECFKSSRWTTEVCVVCSTPYLSRICEQQKRIVLGSQPCCSIPCRNCRTAAVNSGRMLGPDDCYAYLVRHREFHALKIGMAVTPRRMAEHEAQGWETVKIITAPGSVVWRIEQETLIAWTNAGIVKGFLRSDQMPQKGHTETVEDSELAASLALDKFELATEAA